MHFKRFHFLNGRWIKSHKIVDFPLKGFDPTDYLAAVPCNTIQRYKELEDMGKTSSVRATKARNIWKNCNGIIDEANEAENVEDVQTEEKNRQFSDAIFNAIEESNDDISECSNDNAARFSNAERLQSLPDVSQTIKPNCNEVYEASQNYSASIKTERVNSPSCNRRMRQESTSLYTHPIRDDDLQDFHQHKLLPGRHPLDIRYNMRSMVVSSFICLNG